MTREQARDRFWTAWVSGWPVGLLYRWLDPPRAVGIALAIVWSAALAWFGLAWLSRSVREGRVRRALPEYARGYLSLLIIAAGCGLAAVPVLALLGERITLTALSTGAFFGVVAVLAVWFALSSRRGAHARRRGV